MQFAFAFIYERVAYFAVLLAEAAVCTVNCPGRERREEDLNFLALAVKIRFRI